jgi:glycine/D-amino acid oxidase-like deaminating enzyme
MRQRKDIQAELDVLIIGGGIAGLWLLNRLVAQRYTVALIERGELGGGQTVASQGIIHGGMKYSLSRQDVHSLDALAQMPALWRECLEGSGEVNLSAVPVNADATYMWSDGSLLSKAASLIAAKVVRSPVSSLRADDRPPPFADYSGTLYRLDECVLDVPSLVRVLAAPHAGRIFRLDASKAEFGADGALEWDDLPVGRVSIKARRIVVTAGQGFDDLARLPGLNGFMQQRRPLHMVLVEHDCAMPLYGYCIAHRYQPCPRRRAPCLVLQRPVGGRRGRPRARGADRGREAGARTLCALDQPAPSPLAHLADRPRRSRAAGPGSAERAFCRRRRQVHRRLADQAGTGADAGATDPVAAAGTDRHAGHDGRTRRNPVAFLRRTALGAPFPVSLSGPAQAGRASSSSSAVVELPGR